MTKETLLTEVVSLYSLKEKNSDALRKMRDMIIDELHKIYVYAYVTFNESPGYYRRPVEPNHDFYRYMALESMA